MPATDTTPSPTPTDAALRDKVLRTIAKRSFCVLATPRPPGALTP
jgi:hypothetical protein